MLRSLPRRAAPSLVRMCSTCAEMVFGESTKRAAICRLVRPRRPAGRPRIRVRSAGARARLAGRDPASGVRSAASTRAASPPWPRGCGPRGGAGPLRRGAAPWRRLGQVEPCPGALPEPAPGLPRPLAASSAGRAADILPSASRISPRAWSSAGSVPGMVARGEHAPTRSSQSRRHQCRRGQVRPHAGEQEREQVGGVGDVGRRLVAALAERDRWCRIGPGTVRLRRGPTTVARAAAVRPSAHPGRAPREERSRRWPSRPGPARDSRARRAR